MLREIKKKMVILNNRRPFKPEISAYLDEMEALDWIYMNLRLDGSNLTKENIASIQSGGFLREGRITDHLLIENLKELRNYLYRMTDMGADLSRRILFDMYSILQEGWGEGEREYRKNTPVIFEYKYNPIIPSEIPAAVDDLAAYACKEEEFQDNILKGVKIHNRIIEIYPFKDNNELLARGAMYFYLMSKAYPLAPVNLSEQEYNDAIIRYLKCGDNGFLYEAAGKEIYNRLELMIQLTGHDN